MIAPDMRGPATRANADRAEVIRNETSYTSPAAEPEADFAALFIARRYRIAALLPAPSPLAGLGRAFA